MTLTGPSKKTLQGTQKIGMFDISAPILEPKISNIPILCVPCSVFGGTGDAPSKKLSLMVQYLRRVRHPVKRRGIVAAFALSSSQ